MLSLYLLFAIVFAFVMHTAYQIVRKRKQVPPECVPLLPMGTSATRSVHRSCHARQPEVKWISMEEFRRLLEHSEDVLFIDLRTSDRAKPLPFSPARVLLLTPSELIDVLRWAPSGNTIVLYGPRDFCSYVAEEVRRIKSGTPLYLLSDSVDDREAA